MKEITKGVNKSIHYVLTSTLHMVWNLPWISSELRNWIATELMCYHCQVGGLWVALSSLHHSQVRASSSLFASFDIFFK
jgi:hypothetical protein